MEWHTATIELVKDQLKELDNAGIDIVLSLLHARKCDKVLNPDCRDCSWKASRLCLPIRNYLETQYPEEEEEEESE